MEILLAEKTIPCEKSQYRQPDELRTAAPGLEGPKAHRVDIRGHTLELLFPCRLEDYTSFEIGVAKERFQEDKGPYKKRHLYH